MPRPPPASLGMLLALPLLLFTGWIALHRGDAPAPDDGDLRIAAPTAVGANGYERFVAAANAARLPRDEATWRRFHAFREGLLWEPEWISALTAENEAATALLRAGVASPAFAFARDAAPRARDERVRTLLLGHALVALSGAQARIALRHGRASSALELASLGLHAGRRLSAADNLDLFGMHMAIRFQTTSLIDLEHAARASRVAPETARRLGALLESSRWRAADWQRVWALEYDHLRVALGALDLSGAGWPSLLLPDAYRWHPNRTTAAIADLYREHAEKSQHFCAGAVPPAGRDARLARLPWSTELVPNAIGQFVIAEVRAHNLDQVQRTRCQLETQVSLVAVLIAVKAYSDGHGRLPERLEDLVPLYLDALPLDRYDGAPLRYSGAVPVLYSVGNDFIDAGGGPARGLLDDGEPGLSLAF